MAAFMGLPILLQRLRFYWMGTGFSKPQTLSGRAFVGGGRPKAKGTPKAKRQGRPPAVFRKPGPNYFPRFTAFFSSAPAENFATLRAAILMVAPVCGLRPLRAFLCDTEKVPKPISATRSPFFRAPVMLSTAVSMADAACDLLIRLPAAIRLIRSALFISSPGRFLLSSARALCDAFADWETRWGYLAPVVCQCQLWKSAPIALFGSTQPQRQRRWRHPG